MNRPSDPGSGPQEFETDTRLPSGEWSGFYLEHHQPQRGWMHLYMNFRDGRIEGEGTDYVGPWVIEGKYDLNSQSCQWTKRYLGKHRVTYEGTITEVGIKGTWNIRNWNNGPFHIWPQSQTELMNLYMREELESQTPSVLLGTAPVPPQDLV